ncbi:cytochrome c oxidase subunit 3, partial [Sinorhizobium meliloti]
MSIVAFFLAAIAAIIAWWLAGQRLTSRPWLEVGHFHDRRGATRLPPAKIGLGVFLAVVGALFSLAISAYFMRMASSDWGALPLPGLLWLNTGILAAGSITLHWTKVEAERRNDEAARIGLLAGLALGLAFLAGQLFAWRALSDAGYFLAGNPANSFFYLLTGMHGLHIIGGLFALGRVTAHASQTPLGNRTRLSIELC